MLVAKAWGCWVVRNDEWLVWYMWGAGGGVKIAGCCSLGVLVMKGKEWGRVGKKMCE